MGKKEPLCKTIAAKKKGHHTANWPISDQECTKPHHPVRSAVFCKIDECRCNLAAHIQQEKLKMVTKKKAPDSRLQVTPDNFMAALTQDTRFAISLE